MLVGEIKSRNLIKECIFRYMRSSGPGGQHVNKVSTKVELLFNINGSALLSNEEKQILLIKLTNKLNSNCELVIQSQEYRSQIDNKQKTIEKFYNIVAMALIPEKKRKPSRPTRKSIEKRLSKKKNRAEIKVYRRKINMNQ